MKIELEQNLVKDFPLLYADRNRSLKETAMCWGFECGDGWEPLIRCGSEKLEKLIKEISVPRTCNALAYLPRASQVKEKYGTLRFYMTSETDEMSDVIQEMERESESVCETCGSPGRIRGKGWYYTACEAHTKEGDL